MILNIGGDYLVDVITEIYKNGIEYLLDQQMALLDIVIKEIFIKYPNLQKGYDYEGKQKENLMPDIGIEFLCKWDEEHGIGAMMHKRRVVQIGGAETAFMTWVPEENKQNDA